MHVHELIEEVQGTEILFITFLATIPRSPIEYILGNKSNVDLSKI